MAKDTRRRSKSQIERDRARIAQMYLHGKLQVEIAEEVGLSQSTISNDLKAIQGQWRESSLIDMNEAKARELARIDELERTYWEAWLNSCEDAELERVKQAGGEGGAKRAEITKERRGQSGNPAFLSGVERCIKMRIDVIGLEAPKKRELAGPGGTPLVININRPSESDSSGGH